MRCGLLNYIFCDRYGLGIMNVEIVDSVCSRNESYMLVVIRTYCISEKESMQEE